MSRKRSRTISSTNPRRTAPGLGRRLTGARGDASLRMVTLLAAVGFVLFLAGCGIRTQQSTFDVKGIIAREQLDLFLVTVWVSLFIFVTVGGTMAVVVWKYREKPEDAGKPMPSQGHGNPLIEISLITASIALLVIIAIPTLEAIWLTHEMPTDKEYWSRSVLGGPGGWMEKASPGSVPELASKEVLEITVYGYQWWWAFDYKQFGVVTANEFVMPKDKVVKFNLRSNNVIHSFWLPKIAGKVDLMPGRANWLWMMTDDDANTYDHGLYYGQCAQYCGEAHAYMLFRARVVTDEEFATYIANLQKKIPVPGAPADQQHDWAGFVKNALADASTLKTPEARGAFLFMTRATCVQCHAITGTPAQGTLGPNLSNVASRTSLAAGIMDNLNNAGTAIDPERQRTNMFNWVTHSYVYKPGSLMWYPKNGLEALMYQGITLSRLTNAGVGLGLAQVEALDLTDTQRAQLKATPDPELSLILTRDQLVKLTKGLDQEQFSKFSSFPSQQDFHDIVSFLMTLK